jgi:hypothetical protein
VPETRDQYDLLFDFFFGVAAFFSPVPPGGAIVPLVTVPAGVDIAPVVPDVSVDVVPVAAVLVVLVPVVAMVLLEVTPVSVAAVSVFAFSSFLQPSAKINIAETAIDVTKRDFFILLLFLSFTGGNCGQEM